MNIRLLNVENGVIGLNTHKIIVGHINPAVDGEIVSEETLYVNDDGYKEWTEQQIAKHKLLTLVSDEPLDTSEYEWMDGIKLRTDNHVKEIQEIAACGSLEAYEASLPESRDAFEVETDYRLSMLELGI